ncbi:TPA: hypothetical protein ACKJ98_002147, partial [Neisseria gonorrhoeae]
ANWLVSLICIFTNYALLLQYKTPFSFSMQLISQKQRKQRLQRRNEKIRELFGELTNKYPQWRIDAVIEEVAGRVFLSPRTVEAIISYEGIYAES